MEFVSDCGTLIHLSVALNETLLALSFLLSFHPPSLPPLLCPFIPLSCVMPQLFRPLFLTIFMFLQNLTEADGFQHSLPTLTPKSEGTLLCFCWLDVFILSYQVNERLKIFVVHVHVD